MDAPKREVSWLESFPADIWAYFAYYLPGEQICRLMMTGATFLWQRLKSPAVVKSIKLGTDVSHFKSYPMFLNDFASLEELCIHTSSQGWSLVSPLSIDSIPSGVRKLELSGEWDHIADKLFGEQPTSQSVPLKLSECLPHLQALHLSSSPLANYSWMMTVPPTLTSLRLSDWNGTVPLPPSLLHLKVGSIALSRWTSKWPALPPSLESLIILSSGDGGDKLIPLLPPSIRQLSFGSAIKFSPKSPQTLLERLPKSLTWLEVPESTDTCFEANPELTSLLPSTLTELKFLPTLPSSAWHLLPSGLTTLSFPVPRHLAQGVSTSDDQHRMAFDSLPKSLTSLELIGPDQYFCGPPDSASTCYFPPQLTCLKIPMVQLSPETAKRLPSSLTLLEIGNLCERVCEHLPKGLKTLTSSQTLMTPQLIKSLPKSLFFLRLSLYPSDGTWYDCNTGQKIDAISTLPEYSIHEKCAANGFNWKDVSLPSTLTYFDLPAATGLGDSFTLHHSLTNLVELHLRDAKEFTDLSIPLLPRHLTTLKLASSSKISGKSFEYLPKSLIILDLNKSESIFDSDIQHLPRTLKQAYLNRAIHLTEQCLADLPPHIQKLEMRQNSKIPTSALPHFPYALRSTQLYGTAVFATWHLNWGAAMFSTMTMMRPQRPAF